MKKILSLAAVLLVTAGLTSCDTQQTSTHTHTLISHEAKAATCIATGNEAYWECSDCKLLFSDAEGKNQIDDIPTTKKTTTHRWDEGGKTEAQCGVDGEIVYTCQDCERTKSETIKAEDHNYGEDGVCTNCGHYTQGIQFTTVGEEVTVYGYTGTDTKVIIPAKHSDKPVTKIKGFGDNTIVKEIVLPSTLKSIEENAFNATTNLTTINLPEGLENIGKSSFAHTPVNELVIPSTVKTIGEHPFINCNGLSTLSVASGNQYYEMIDGGLVEITTKKLINLTCNTIDIPNGIKIVGKYTFFKKSGINEIFVPKSVEKFETQSFDRINMSGTQSVIINYEGTEEEWNAIEKESNWNNQVAVTVNYNQIKEN